MGNGQGRGCYQSILKPQTITERMLVYVLYAVLWLLPFRLGSTYYNQIQGCMAMLHLNWCDFVVFTNKDLYVERIRFKSTLWNRQMSPELNSFYYFKYLSSAFSNEQRCFQI